MSSIPHTLRFRITLFALSIVLIGIGYACTAKKASMKTRFQSMVCDPCVYVANQSSNNVAVIDGATNNVIHHIPAGKTPQFLAVNPAGSRVYVSTHAQVNSGLVTVIDTATYNIVANIAVGPNPTGLALDSSGSRLYVVNSGDNTLSVIDTSTNQVIGAPVPIADRPYDIVVSSDDTRIYISAENVGKIQVLDTATLNQVGALIDLGGAPTDLALNASGSLLYVADFSVGNVRVIDTVSLTVVDTIPAGSGSIALALNPTGSYLYTADFGFGTGNTVSVIDTATKSIAGTIPVGMSPHGLAMNANGTALYAANQESNDISVIDPSTNSVVATIPVDARPVDVAVVYAGTTVLPIPLPHIASAVNGQPVFNPGGTTLVESEDTIEFTVRVPQSSVGSPADIQYYLNPNLQFQWASAGTQAGTICEPATLSAPLPNGVMGNAQLLTCSLVDGSKPLIINAKVTGLQAPRDDPYTAVVSFPPSFSDSVPVRAKIQHSPSGISTIGSQRTAIILASAPGAPPHPYANKANTASIFYSASNSGSARNYLAQASYGPDAAGFATIAGATGAEGTTADIYGPFTVASNGCMGSGDVLSAIGTAINYLNYERIVIAVNDPDLCGHGGLSGIATVTSQGQTKQITTCTVYNEGFEDTTVTGKIGNTVLHEYGHQLGLGGEVGGWDCGNSAQALDGKCSNLKYLDHTDAMGGAKYAHYNPVNKERLGWLEGGRVLPIWNSGTYSINAYEDSAENVKVLKIPRKWRATGTTDPEGLVSGYYYIAYRHPKAPWDDWITQNSSFANGVAIYIDEGVMGAYPALFDLTPNSIAGVSDFGDGALLAGQTFTDTASGITVTVVSVIPNAATVEVTIQPHTTRFIQVGTSYPHGNLVLGAQVQGTGNYTPGSAVSLDVVAPPGFMLKYWLDSDGSWLATSNPYSFQLDEDRVIWAAFGGVPPTNDNFITAQPVTTLPSQFTLYTQGATTEAGEPSDVPCGAMNVDPSCTVWYAYTPSSMQDVKVDTAGSDYGTIISVYTGNAVDSLSPIPGACGFWSQGHGQPEITFTAMAGTTYYIQIGATNVGQNMSLEFNTP